MAAYSGGLDRMLGSGILSGRSDHLEGMAGREVRLLYELIPDITKISRRYHENEDYEAKVESLTLAAFAP
jgi:hypothetical protein